MKAKTKIKKILPFWLCFLTIALALQTLKLPVQKISSFTNQTGLIPIVPTVLGESISLRGDSQRDLQVNPPVLTGKLDLKRVKAAAFLVYDEATKQTLAEKNATKPLGIASLTKLMTGLLAYEYGNLSGSLTIQQKQHINIAPLLGLKNGDEVKTIDLFNSMLVGSSNDAADEIADYVAELTGKNFVFLMNQTAKNLGLSQTKFSNPWGFDFGENYSTAEDLKKLVIATQKLSAFVNLGKLTNYQFTSNQGEKYKIAATNKLIGIDPEVEAIKTGFTPQSDQAMITKINRGGHKFVIIVLESPDRDKDTLEIKKQIVDNFQWP